ncbi:MAG TPA: hypothetical protein VGP73_18860 [Thermoanaerobaculia bacterium]
MVDRESSGILQRLVSQWEFLNAEIQRLHGEAQVRPSDPYRALATVEGTSPEVASFVLSPVVFKLPERASAVNADLFVVVEGRLSFGRRDFAERRVLATHEFTTKVAYFRHSFNCLKHVYGAHYDFSVSELGHPVFHGQIRNYPELAAGIKTHYGIDHEVVDLVRGLLKTVRVPTAQMDVFSLFVQLCADHLLYSQSGPEVKAAFNSLLQRSEFCQGAAFQIPRLMTEEARKCYRAWHWYPHIE